MNLGDDEDDYNGDDDDDDLVLWPLYVLRANKCLNLFKFSTVSFHLNY